MLGEIIADLSNWMYTYLLVILLVAAGLFFTIRNRFPQLRLLREAIRVVVERPEKEGSVSSFQALMVSTASRVGTGNIIGVSVAICMGGYGAVFWMWVVALLGMLTKCVEVTLGQYYRVKGEDGVYYGGPMYYIERGMGRKWKPLAVIFSVTIILGGLGTAAFAQPYTMSTAVQNSLGIPAWITTVAAAVICGVVLLGGVKSIGGFCEKLTPAMCLIYVVGVLGVIIINLEHVPAAFAAIFRYAFAPMPAVGGLAGSTVALALRQGAARGTFSNEAGCGSSPITHATAITDHPFKEGMYGCFEVFVDTLVVCTMTALGILCAGPEIWQSGLEAEALTMAAFSTAYGSTVGKLLVTIPLALFAFSTMVGWEINYESAFFYLFPKGKQSKVFKYAIRILWLVPGFLALGKTPQVIWTIVDIVSGFWCIPNAIALLALSGVFMRIYRDYESKYISKTKPVSQPLEYVGKD